jgi:hypothetical protein
MNEFREILLQNLKHRLFFLFFSWQTLANAGTGKASWHAGKTTSRAIKILFFQQCRSEFTGFSCIIQ